MFFILLGARRKQSLFTISVDNTFVKNDKAFLLPNRIQQMKQPKPHRPLEPIFYSQYVDKQKQPPEVFYVKRCS